MRSLLLLWPKSSQLSVLDIGLYYSHMAHFSIGIVVACGDHTVIGRIAGLTTRIQPQPTPIARELRLFMHAISTWACLLGATCGLAMVWLRYVQKHLPIKVVMFCSALQNDSLLYS